MSAVNFLTSGIGKFWSLNWEKSTVFGIGNGTLYRYQLYKEKNRCVYLLPEKWRISSQLRKKVQTNEQNKSHYS